MGFFAKSFIIKASECHLGVNIPSDDWEGQVEGLVLLETFLNSPKQLVLYAQIKTNNQKLTFLDEAPDSNTRLVVFVKNEPLILEDDNILNSIQITSICGPPSLALYHNLNSVFAPLLSQDGSVNLQRQLINFQTNLRSDILANNDTNNINTNSLSVVNSLEHEVEYWENIAHSSKGRSSATATSYITLLNTIAKDFSVLGAMPLNEAEDLLENAHTVLDDLWRHTPPYPKERITHLMDLIGNGVNHSISQQINECELWGTNYNTVSELLSECISLGEKWLGSCKELTEIFWPNYNTNLWKEEPYIPQDLKKLVERLEEILHVQTLLRQLTRLLTPQEQDSLKTNEMFKPFKALDLMDSSELWTQACKQFEYLLRPAEERVASKLKHQLGGTNINTRQLLYDFARYSELINRPVVKQSLVSERQHLLNSLYNYVRQLQKGSESEVFSKYDTPRIISEIITAKQQESKAQEVFQTAKKLLSDLQGYENLEQLVLDVLKDLKQLLSELFDSWTGEVSQLIKEDLLNLKDSDAVVQFSKNNQLMKVNYATRLVTLVAEVRQFKALGYHVPSHIEQISEHAKKFMYLARVLEQIANFHNTIGDRMITSQRPMMLASALELSRLVQEEKVVSWGDTKSVEKYVETLQKAVEKLSKENNFLASYYYQIMEKIKFLEEVDLIKDYNVWRETTRQMRNLLSQVEDKGFQNMTTWKGDVEEHLCRVLEKQYLKSLDTLHLYLPEIYTDIVYRKARLQFSPEQEVLKEKYQQQLRKFLDIPRTFRGVSESVNLFGGIVERNNDNLEKVSKHTDNLFDQLQACLKHWQSWLQLEDLDVSKLINWQNWDLHFRASKTFGQEIAKLPSNEERIGCFLIGLTRLRQDLESHNRSYWDQLVLSLKDSIAEDVVKLQNYVDPSTAALTRQPVTLEEVGDSGAAHANILKHAEEMETQFREMIKKSEILSSWTREQVDSVNRLKGAWERLQSLLENHQHIIAKQMETIRTTLNVESENVEKELERFSAKWEQVKPKRFAGQFVDQSIEELWKQFQEIKEKIEQWEKIKQQRDKLLADYEKFNFEKPQWDLLDDIEEDLRNEQSAWALFEEFYSDLEIIAKEEWIVFRKKIYKLEDFLVEWQNKLKNDENKNSDLVIKILQETQKLQTIIPSLKYVRGEDFSDKHWMDIFDLLHIPTKPLDLLIVQDFINVSEILSKSTKELQVICKRAASEIVVRQALAELDQWEVQSRFVLTPQENSRKNLMLVKDFKEVLSKIGDNQSLLQSVKNSADYESFSERAVLWEEKLGNLDHNLTLLATIQRKWVYLEPIFGGGTLIQEKGRFEKIDKDFRHVLIFIEKDPRVASLHRYPNLGSVLRNLQEQLSKCQKSLDHFLMEKRDKFPRFLFLDDNDLLEVVGQSSKEQVIQSHLKKLFSGIHSIQLNEEGSKITAMCSWQGEEVTLGNSVEILGRPVEEWLNSLVKEMQGTLKELLVQCLNEGKSADPLKYPSQILCLADNINFTIKTEQAISTMTLPPLLAYYKAQLMHYSSLELSSGESEDDNEVLTLKLKALLLDTIHHTTVIELLLDVNISKPTEWHWQRQLRFYSNSMGEVTIKMANARMDYSYEYLGNAAKLVRTPLTDRCFLTLSQGMHLGMGSNPYGPAGTGKTESVKALGQLLGRQVLVFNCDEGIDSSSMGRILSGLVRSGAWGCFDEFNRLDEATLSAVSMQIQPIQSALKEHKTKVILLEKEIELNKHCGIFVTMNPASGSYGGRNKLPDNLKQLFRPVVMTHPDHEQIARTLLHCDGYQNADLIGRKLVEVFKASDNLLSKQQHYDWGLRALKTILLGCGRALKLHRKLTEEAEGNQLLTELTLVESVLKTDTLSKLTFEDSKKFEGLLGDVFKDVTVERIRDEKLLNALKASCGDMKLVINERQLEKCLQLYEQLQQRIGVAIVGPPSSGKSTIRELLFLALSKMGKLLKRHVFNPKSMPKTDLLGQVDLDTRQWSDGVLTLYSLEVVSQPNEVTSWIICDGGVDPDWVESLNSVLDDNRLLSLPSGWRIQFGQNVNFLFETHDLSHASPATISRMGIIFLNQQDLPLTDYVESYLIRNQLDELRSYLNENFFKCLNWLFEEGEITLDSSRIAIARTVLTHLAKVNGRTEFHLVLINGFAQQLQEDFRELFCQMAYNWMDETPPPIILKSCYNQERDIIESYYTNPNITIDTITRRVPLVMTGEIIKIVNDLKLCLEVGFEQHFLIVGPHGSAKSLIIEHLLDERSDVELTTINCSANLGPKYIINKISQKCITVNTSKGKVYKPKRGALVLHLKNLHLLKPNRWDTNIVIEFLHQFITYGAFFDGNLELVGYENITIVGSLEATTTISTRFTSIVHIYNVQLPDSDDLSVIVTVYLTGIMKESFPNWPKAKIVKLATFLTSIYEKVRNLFFVNALIDYNCSPHDIINWCSQILRYKDILQQKPQESLLLEIVYYQGLAQFSERFKDEEDKEKLQRLFEDAFKAQWSQSSFPKEQFYVAIRQNSSNLCKVDKNEWSMMVNKGIAQFGRDGQNLEVVVNQELLGLCASASRILSSPEGHLVMVGKAGIGRKSAVKIISALQGARFFHLNAFKQPQLNLDLKSLLQLTGIEGEQVYLLFEDHILSNVDVLCNLNILIAAGEVPNLYNLSELESMTSGLKDEANRDNFEGHLIDFFFQRVQKNLHIIACIDVDNELISNIFENCPAFLHRSSIIWKSEWCQETIQLIPSILIDKYNGSSTQEIAQNDNFPKLLSVLEEQNCAPFQYVSLVNLYVSIFTMKKSTILSKISKLEAGVSKLTEAANLVKNLKEKASIQKELLAEKQSKANSALNMISNTMQNANTHKEEMEVLKRKTETENQQLISRKAQIEVELSEVEPLIQEARSAVGNIKAEALSEIRSLRAPPEVIRDILEGVLRLMGIQDTSWNSMKTFLAKRGVKEEIRSFDASRITTENRHAVERLISNKPDSFDAKAAKRASVAAAPLATWVAANIKYSHVSDKIRPLEREQNKLKQNLTNAEMQLGELSTELSDVDASVDQLKGKLAAFTKEAAEVEIDLNKAQATLAAAEGLVGKLDEEYRRWQEQLKELSEQIGTLPDFCLLASAVIIYLSAENEERRRVVLHKWMKELNVITLCFNFEEFLSNEREQMQWQSEGLPCDKLSIQNAIITLQAKNTPLLIDPTSSAIIWFKNHFKHKQIEAITQENPKFITNVELAVRFGKVLIIEEIEKVPSTLLPILRQEFTFQGERRLVSFNGKLIDYHNDFMLVLSSRNEHIKLEAATRSLITSMNFAVTHEGLSEQLLFSAIRQENPQLEDRRKQILREKEELQDKQYQLQNRLLEDLANSTGDILANSKLLASLNETKASSIEISKALEESLHIQEKLQLEYDVYKEISIFGSYLYFACNTSTDFNILYVISVSAYIKLFLSSLKSIEDSITLEVQKKQVFESVYSYLTRGVFKADRLMIAMNLIYRLFGVPPEEWSLFVGKPSISNREEQESLPTWISPQSKNSLLNLQSVLPELYNTLQLQEQSFWSQFNSSAQCEKELPTHCSKITEFQKVLVVQALRPDRLHSAMSSCVVNLTSLRAIDPTHCNLAQILKESSNKEPILILTTSGSDPSKEIRELASSNSFIEVAMGEGQESKALSSLVDAAQSGQWLILKNLHLVTDWLSVLCQNLQNLNAKDGFRLWLVTEYEPKFSSVLAQNSVKVVYEAPQGLKNNLLRTFESYGVKYVEKLSGNACRIFCVLACIHGIVQERRNYIPQGWSKWYEFSDTDLGTCLQLMEDLWHVNSPKVPWEFIGGLFRDAVYGGRIEYEEDVRILKSYHKQYLNDEVLSHRWSPFGLKTTLPTSPKYESYVSAFRQLPERDSPSLFGLPPNIDRAWESHTSTKISQTLKEITLSIKIRRDFDRELWQKNLAPLISLWKKLNHGLDFIKMPLPTPNSALTPMEAFIFEELYKSVELIQKIHKHFTMLNRACKGGTIPTKCDIELGNSLIAHEVPKVWKRVWEGPSEPNHFLKSLMMKASTIIKWKNDNFEKIIQNPINLSAFLRPDAFLASYKQEFSRSSQIAMDQLEIETSWRPSNRKDSLILTGLLIEGALFENSELTECQVHNENINPAPNCYITWREKASMVNDDSFLQVSLYYNPSRDKKLTTLQVKGNHKNDDKWIQAGLAFYLGY